MYSCVLNFFFFLFSTQNQIPQIMIALVLVTYQIKVLSVVIRTTFENFKFFFTVSRKIGLKFLSFGIPIFTGPNRALDRRTILCLYVAGFQTHVFKHVKALSEQLKKMKE